MRILGIDYAKKRVGIAISDENGKMAFPFTVIPNNDKILKEIIKIIKENNVSKIVLGLPLDLKNEPTHNTKPVLNFKKKLESVVKIPVILEKEFYTTKEAERVQGKIKQIDASAAALILKHYLSKYKL